MFDDSNIKRVDAVSKEVEASWITIVSRRDKTYQQFLAKDLEKWINGDKLPYKYFTFRSNNPYIFFYSKDGVMLTQDKAYLTVDLPDFEKIGKEYYEGIDESDVITVHYSDAWWEKCLNWKEIKAKRDADRKDKA